MFVVFYITVYTAFVWGLTSITHTSWIPLWILLAPIATIFILLGLFGVMTPFYRLTGPDNRFFTYMTRSMGDAVGRFVARLRPIFTGLDNIPLNGRTVFYSTHKSYTDVFILLQSIKRPLAFTPKKTLYKIPIVGGWLKAMGCFMVDRDNDRDTVKRLVEAIDRIKKNHAMIVFPEGGTSDRHSEKLLNIKAGSLKIATKSKATIIPVRIYGNSHVRGRMPFYHTDKKVVYAKPMTYDTYKDLSSQELADHLKETINHL